MERRVQHALELLRNEDRSIAEILRMQLGSRARAGWRRISGEWRGWHPVSSDDRSAD